MEIELQECETIKDLKSKLEDEINFPPERQQLYILGLLLDANFDALQVKELLEPWGFCASFTLLLPKASSAKRPDPKWLILGKEKKFKTIMLLPNMEEDLTSYLPLKNNCFGISYAVEGTIEQQNRKFHVRAYTVSKQAKTIRFVTDGNLEVKVFQTLTDASEETEMKGRLEVFDESRLDKEKKLDKALKVAKIGYYTSKGISSIIGAILGIIGLHFHLNPAPSDDTN